MSNTPQPPARRGRKYAELWKPVLLLGFMIKAAQNRAGGPGLFLQCLIVGAVIYLIVVALSLWLDDSNPPTR